MNTRIIKKKKINEKLISSSFLIINHPHLLDAESPIYHIAMHYYITHTASRACVSRKRRLLSTNRCSGDAFHTFTPPMRARAYYMHRAIPFCRAPLCPRRVTSPHVSRPVSSKNYTHCGGLAIYRNGGSCLHGPCGIL